MTEKGESARNFQEKQNMKDHHWKKTTQVLILVKAHKDFREDSSHSSVNFCLKMPMPKVRDISCLKVCSTCKFNFSTSMDSNKGQMIPGLHRQSCVPSAMYRGASGCWQWFLPIPNSCAAREMSRQEICSLNLGHTDPTNSPWGRSSVIVLEIKQNWSLLQKDKLFLYLWKGSLEELERWPNA